MPWAVSRGDRAAGVVAGAAVRAAEEGGRVRGGRLRLHVGAL